MPTQARMSSPEPLPHELSTDINSVKELLLAKLSGLRALVKEHDRLYMERDRSARRYTDTAIRNVANTAKKAEVAQHEYNIRSNEFRAQLADQATHFLSKDEYNASRQNITDTIERMDREIRDLREFRMQLAGLSEKNKENASRVTWTVGIVVSVAVSIAAMIVNLIRH